MKEASDIIGQGRVVAMALYTYAAAEALAFLVIGYTLMNGEVTDNPHALTAHDLTDILVGVTLLVSGVLTLRWIYRANAGAQALGAGMSVSPGWNVGWFFIPIANLWKPFEGVRETWQVSHDPANWPAVPVPALLRIWWGLWLVTTMLSNASFRLSSGAALNETALYLDLADALLSVPLSLALILIVRQTSEAQANALAGHVFA